MNAPDIDDVLLADGFEAALIGVGRRCGRPPIAVYSRARCIAVLMADGLSHEDAEEHFEFNVVGAWIGEQTPMFIDDCPRCQG